MCPAVKTALYRSGTPAGIPYTFGHISRCLEGMRSGPQMHPCSGLRRFKIPAPLAGLRLSGHASHYLDKFVSFQSANASSQPIPFQGTPCVLGGFCTSARKRAVDGDLFCPKVPAPLTSLHLSGHASRSWTVLHRFGPQTRPCSGLRCSKVPAPLTSLRLSGHASRSWTVLHRFGPQAHPCRGLRCSKIPTPLAGLCLSGHA